MLTPESSPTAERYVDKASERGVSRRFNVLTEECVFLESNHPRDRTVKRRERRAPMSLRLHHSGGGLGEDALISDFLNSMAVEKGRGQQCDREVKQRRRRIPPPPPRPPPWSLPNLSVCPKGLYHQIILESSSFLQERVTLGCTASRGLEQLRTDCQYLAWSAAAQLVERMCRVFASFIAGPFSRAPTSRSRVVPDLDLQPVTSLFGLSLLLPGRYFRPT